MCGGSLEGMRPHAVYCSRNCKTKASDQRRKATVALRCAITAGTTRLKAITDANTRGSITGRAMSGSDIARSLGDGDRPTVISDTSLINDEPNGSAKPGSSWSHGTTGCA